MSSLPRGSAASRRRIAAAAVTLVVPACSPILSQGSPQTEVGGLCLDGHPLLPGSSDLREALERRLGPRARDWFPAASAGPLVLLDGVAVPPEQLTGVPAGSVASVELLEAFRAVAEFGARGTDGAIVVVTRRALEDGRAFPASDRPPHPCRPAG